MKKILTLILIAVLSSTNLLSVYAVEKQQSNKETNQFTVVRKSNDLIEYQTYEDGNKVNIKVIDNEVYQSINDGDFIVVGSFEKESTLPDVSLIQPRAGTWSSNAPQYASFAINRDQITVAAIVVILNAGLVFHGGYSYISDLSIAVYDLVIELNRAITVYSKEDYYSWSTCSIFVKTGNVRIYKDSLRTQLIKQNSGLKEWYISDPNLPTSPAGCRYI